MAKTKAMTYAEIPSQLTAAESRFLQAAFEMRERCGAMPVGSYWTVARNLEKRGLAKRALGNSLVIVGFHATPHGLRSLDAYYEKIGIAKPSGLVTHPQPNYSRSRRTWAKSGSSLASKEVGRRAS